MKSGKGSAEKTILSFLIILVAMLINTELYAQNQEQDTVYLKNGTIIKGEILKVVPSERLTIQTDGGSVFVCEFKEIERYEMKNTNTEDVRPTETEIGKEAGEETSTELPSRFTGNLNLFAGRKILDDGDWDPAHEHNEFGIMIDIKKTDWPVSIAVNILRSEGDGTVSGYVGHPINGILTFECEGETTEIGLGLRKVWDDYSIVRPFIGGGLSLTQAEFKVSTLGLSSSDDDTGVGVWVDAGVYVTLSKNFNLGLMARWSRADITMNDVDAEAGGIHYGAIAGFHW